MALMVAPEEAYENLKDNEQEGFEGRYGFYEAIDYTPSRLPRGQSQCSCTIFHGASPGNELFYHWLTCFYDKPMQKRFEAEPQFQATLSIIAGTNSEGNCILFANRTYIRQSVLHRAGTANAGNQYTQYTNT